MSTACLHVHPSTAAGTTEPSVRPSRGSNSASMQPLTTPSASGREAASAPSLPTSVCMDDHGGDDHHSLLLGEGVEDVFFDQLDDADFSVLAADVGSGGNADGGINGSSGNARQGMLASGTSSVGPSRESSTALLSSSTMKSGGDADIPLHATPTSRRHSCQSRTRDIAGVDVGNGGNEGGVGTGDPSANRDRLPSSSTTGGDSLSSHQDMIPNSACHHVPSTGLSSILQQRYSSSTAGASTHSLAVSKVSHVPDASPRQTVCLLVVGFGQRSTNRPAHGSGGGELGDVLLMLTRELEQHGHTPEIDHVVSGDRAIQRVKALARHGLRYGMILLEIEGSWGRAAATARDIRAANATAPIVAVASPHVPRPSDDLSGDNSTIAGTAASITRCGRDVQNEIKLHFSECLTTPVSGSTVRSLAARWLLAPPDLSAPAVADGVEIAADAHVSQYRGNQEPCSSESTRTAMDDSWRGEDGGLASRSSWPQREASLRGRPSSSPSWGMSTRPWARLRSNCGLSQESRVSHKSVGPRRLETVKSIGIFASQKGRVFGGTAGDRAAPCKLFSEDFAKDNAEAQEREFDFVFRHGTVVLKVEEDNFGRIVPMVYGACEYARTHFGDLTGKPLQAIFDAASTNKETAANILQYIEEGEMDSISSYINLKSEGRLDMASFVSMRPLSRRPQRDPSLQRLTPWYVVLKVCLPSTLGLIKEPALLEKMYSRSAMAVQVTGAKKGGGSRRKSASRGTDQPAPRRGGKKGKISSTVHRGQPGSSDGNPSTE